MEPLERIAIALERIADAMAAQAQPSAATGWTLRRAERFVSTMSGPAFRVLAFLHGRFPEPCTVQDMVRAGIVAGSRGIGPIVVSIERAADALDLPQPIERVMGVKYKAATYSLRPEFRHVWRPR
jgi:hypothetical protein